MSNVTPVAILISGMALIWLAAAYLFPLTMTALGFTVVRS